MRNNDIFTATYSPGSDPLMPGGLTLLCRGYDFRMVRDRLFGTGKRYLTFGPSKKSMKGIGSNGLLSANGVIDRKKETAIIISNNL